MKELEKNELMEVDGGILPLIIAGVAISGKTLAWIAAGTLFAAGVYTGYKEAAEKNETVTVDAISY
jgi:lactobin A/cerein 7B family class IIb bacteriocin